MKKTIVTLLTFVITGISFGQANYNNELIKLGKNYKNFMFIVIEGIDGAGCETQGKLLVNSLTREPVN